MDYEPSPNNQMENTQMEKKNSSNVSYNKTFLAIFRYSTSYRNLMESILSKHRKHFYSIIIIIINYVNRSESC